MVSYHWFEQFDEPASRLLAEQAVALAKNVALHFELALAPAPSQVPGVQRC